MYKVETDAAAQEQLMTSITTALRISMLVDDGMIRTGDRDKLVPLIDLLENMLPDEDCIEAYLKKTGELK